MGHFPEQILCGDEASGEVFSSESSQHAGTVFELSTVE